MTTELILLSVELISSTEDLHVTTGSLERRQVCSAFCIIKHQRSCGVSPAMWLSGLYPGCCTPMVALFLFLWLGWPQTWLCSGNKTTGAQPCFQDREWWRGTGTRSSLWRVFFGMVTEPPRSNFTSPCFAVTLQHTVLRSLVGPKNGFRTYAGPRQVLAHLWGCLDGIKEQTRGNGSRTQNLYLRGLIRTIHSRQELIHTIWENKSHHVCCPCCFLSLSLLWHDVGREG